MVNQFLVGCSTKKQSLENRKGTTSRTTNHIVITQLCLFINPSTIMQLTLKTLKGEKFVVNAEETNTIAEVKTIVVSILDFVPINDEASGALHSCRKDAIC